MADDNPRSTDMSEQGWTRALDQEAPEGEEVETLSANGLQQTLKRQGRFWFTPDGKMYVYYTPEYWRPLEPEPPR